MPSAILDQHETDRKPTELAACPRPIRATWHRTAHRRARQPRSNIVGNAQALATDDFMVTPRGYQQSGGERIHETSEH